MDRRNYALILILLLAASPAIYSAYYAWAVPAISRTAIYEPGSGTVPCSYMNYLDSGTVFGRNCKTGANDFSATNPCIVANSEISAIGTSGGKIVFEEAAYPTCSTTITVTSPGLVLQGLGREKTILTWSGNNDGISVSGSANDGLEVRDLTMIGPNNGAVLSNGILVTNSRRGVVQGVDMHFWQTTSGRAMINLTGSSPGGSNWQIIGNHFWNNQNGVMLTGASTNLRLISNYFSWTAGSTGTQVSVAGSSSLARIIGNLFEGSLKRVSITANSALFEANNFESNANSGTNDLTVSGLDIIQGNYFTNGIVISGSVGVTFVNNISGSNVSATGTNHVIRSNVGFNPMGLIANPIKPPGSPTIGINGNSGTIDASTAYLINGVDIFWVCSLNGATGVSITISQNGDSLQTGMTCSSGMQPIFSTIGQSINFGAFTGGPPTITVFGN